MSVKLALRDPKFKSFPKTFWPYTGFQRFGALSFASFMVTFPFHQILHLINQTSIRTHFRALSIVFSDVMTFAFHYVRSFFLIGRLERFLWMISCILGRWLRMFSIFCLASRSWSDISWHLWRFACTNTEINTSNFLNLKKKCQYPF